MKLKLFLCCMVLGLALVSCDDSEPKFSCNETIDAWVKEHLSEIQKMTRSEWLESDARFSIPMYRAFTPNQRIDFWRKKFQELKTLSWTRDELAHILYLENFFENHLDLFRTQRPSDQQLDELDAFLYKWKTVATEDLGWTNELAFAIVASGQKVLDTKGTLQPMVKGKWIGNISGDKDNNKMESCNCHIDSFFTCGQQEACENTPCDETSLGCGGFLVWSCDGRCEEPPH